MHNPWDAISVSRLRDLSRVSVCEPLDCALGMICTILGMQSCFAYTGRFVHLARFWIPFPAPAPPLSYPTCLHFGPIAAGLFQQSCAFSKPFLQCLFHRSYPVFPCLGVLRTLLFSVFKYLFHLQPCIPSWQPMGLKS